MKFSRKPMVDWDAACSVGNYHGADDDLQCGRYALIGHLIKKAKSASLLDIRCGYRILQQFIFDTCHYTGLDISQVAIAAVPTRSADRFIAIDVEEWNPDSSFDAIVFSDVLYYLKDSRGMLTRMAGVLNLGGMIVASTYQHRHRVRTTMPFATLPIFCLRVTFA